jgi:hypothetical protein
MHIQGQLMRRLRKLALLAAIGAMGVHSGISAAPVGSLPADAEAGSAQLRGNPLWGIPLASLKATGDRPIFSPSRQRPTPPPPPPVAAAPPPPPPTAAAPEQIPLKLLGTITSPRNAIAICLNQATSEVIRLRTGESFEGWTLRDIQAREAVFEKASARTSLTLSSPDDPQVASAAPPVSDGSAAQPQPAEPASAPQSGAWRDGDGNLIAPPPKAR